MKFEESFIGIIHARRSRATDVNFDLAYISHIPRKRNRRRIVLVSNSSRSSALSTRRALGCAFNQAEHFAANHAAACEASSGAAAACFILLLCTCNRQHLTWQEFLSLASCVIVRRWTLAAQPKAPWTSASTRHNTLNI